jgi:hypothetical protein
MREATLGDELLRVREALDAGLAGRAPTVGVGLSPKHFEEFRARGWLTIERLGEWGDAPAYRASHLAFPNWELAEGEFQIGGVKAAARARGLPKATSPWGAPGIHFDGGIASPKDSHGPP